MNKKLKKMLATVSAMAMCATSAISLSAGALYTPTDKEVRPETTSFTASIYGEKVKLHLWQEATGYFDDESIKVYISDKMINDSGKEITFQMISNHMVYRNTPDGPLHDYCTVGLLGGCESYWFDESEDFMNFEKYLSENNIAYEKWECSTGDGGEIAIKSYAETSDGDIEAIYTDDEFFKLLQKIKEDTGLIAQWASPTDMVEIMDVENVLPEPTLTGDSNEDGEVSIADAILIMQSLVNPDEYSLTPQGIANADINGDGITTLDALLIQEMLVKK